MIGNLIVNGGFEEIWNDNHDAIVVQPSGECSTEQVGNIFSPMHWTTWFVHIESSDHEVALAQPEVRDAWRSHDPRRVFEGDKGILFFTFFKKHFGGFMQQVEVERGREIVLGAKAHAWSNSKDGPHPDDAYWSEGAGYSSGYRLEGNAPDDDWKNFLFSVGIDPTGGTNPMADTVVWGHGAHIYNEYQDVPAVSVQAKSNVVTVFLRSSTMWAFKHNDAYWDDAWLVYNDVPVDPGDCVPPRIPYDRHYLLLPQMTDDPIGAMEWRMAAALGSHRDLVTVGHSADDAGVGPVERRITIVNPAKWDGDLHDFFSAHYPGAVVEELTAETPYDMAVSLLPPLGDRDYAIGQIDPRWGGYDFGEQPGGGTIASQGCVVTGMAIILRRTYGTDVTPPELDKILVQARAPYSSDDLLFIGHIPTVFSLFDTYIKDNNFRTADMYRGLLSNGWEVILRRADGAHFVYLERVNTDGTLGIIDTWDGKRKTKQPGDYYGVRAVHVRGGTDSDSDLDPPARKTRGHVSLHLQVMGSGWQEFVSELQPPVVKVLASMEDVLGVKRACQDTTVVWRHVDDNYGGIIDVDPHVGAQRWIAKFKDALHINCERMAQQFPGLKEPYFVVESINEQVNQDAAIVQRLIDFDMAFIEELAALELPVVAGVFTAPVGNPNESQYEMAVPLAAMAERYGAYWAYHNYWRAINGESLLESEWPYYAGRWAEMDRVFVANGVRVKHYGGESGPYATCVDGWRASSCYGGDFDKYLADVMWIDEWIANWNMYNGDRYLGLTLFTIGASYTGWGAFRLDGEHTRRIKEALLARYG